MYLTNKQAGVADFFKKVFFVMDVQSGQCCIGKTHTDLTFVISMLWYLIVVSYGFEDERSLWLVTTIFHQEAR